MDLIDIARRKLHGVSVSPTTLSTAGVVIAGLKTNLEPNNPMCSGRKHTPITSKAQQGLFGSELARRRKGKKGRMAGITTAELESHLRESTGKKLPKRRG